MVEATGGYISGEVTGGTGGTYRRDTDRIKEKDRRKETHHSTEFETESISSDDQDLNEQPDPFYDPTLDEYDEIWVKSQFTSTSDGILECPACFSTLSYDTQKHVDYEQYRAMFVCNCKVITSQVLKNQDGSWYHPVQCVCGCEVAVYDQEQVYHFFHFIVNPPVLES